MNNFIQKFSKNTVGRDFVLSDLHGCYDDLMKKMVDVKFDTSCDRIFSVGDLCDRGPDSFKCINLINEDWFFAVMGNHEWLWLRAHDEFYKLNLFCTDELPHTRIGDYHIFRATGGSIIEVSDRFTMDDLVNTFKTLTELPRAIELETEQGKVGIIHAELPTNDWNLLHNFRKNEVKDVEESLLWGRSMCMFEEHLHESEFEIDNIDKVYAGHTIVPHVMNVANRVYIETGCFLKYRHQTKRYAMEKKGYIMDLTLLEI